ncbi:MAG: hypothetical protein A2756_02975 [Candidatus Ryanbacteria bacterium RIFCSPHIGHO2_01_FULL_48_27]|jgi:F-type H+-transporting ATPase subunit b|uniref:ATP synthase subunit b n=1 Tax=Candidatus Ryanbacteria bacterium RIFCSPHIGHO2_01_FULL_48_27 TaxID=1802115 RepID=A0A1G2G6G5_9BACT|nr:MAG: hypothetical protein A2756_02975 [Candidatus Ryanbacteria bacterium RIFCSPHIGHO2_01_FULL_48_27]
MQEFARQFGIDWKLLASQVVNFFVLLVVLRVFLYQPISRFMRERKDKIAEGIVRAAEADGRLKEAQEVLKEKMREAQVKSLELMRETEVAAKAREAVLLEESRAKGAVLVAEAREAGEAERTRMRDELYREAVGLVRATIEKAAHVSPEALDEALIQKTVKQIRTS